MTALIDMNGSGGSGTLDAGDDPWADDGGSSTDSGGDGSGSDGSSNDGLTYSDTTSLGDLANDVRASASDEVADTEIEDDSSHQGDNVVVEDDPDDPDTTWVGVDGDGDGSIDDETGSDPDDVTGIVDEGDDGVTVGSASGEGATTVDDGATNPATGEPIAGPDGETPTADQDQNQTMSASSDGTNRKAAAVGAVLLATVVLVGGG